MVRQRDIVQSALYYNYPATPKSVATWTDLPQPSVRRVLRELEDKNMVKWIPADEAQNGISGYVRL